MGPIWLLSLVGKKAAGLNRKFERGLGEENAGLVINQLHRGEGSSILVCEEMVPFSLLGNMGSMAEVTGGRRARVEPMMILYMLTLRLRLKENIEKNLFSEIRKSKEEN